MPSRRTKPTRPNRPPRRRSRGPAPIPAGFRTVTPYLTIDGAARAMEFYKEAFGAQELQRQALPDGKLIHGRLRIGDSIVMLSDHFPGAPSSAPTTVGSTTVTLHVYSKDVDALFARAVAAGARAVMPLDDQFWGERYGQLLDPFGHLWSVSMRIRMSKDEQEARRRASMESFTAPETPA